MSFVPLKKNRSADDEQRRRRRKQTPEWDITLARAIFQQRSTVNDLNAMKATPEEIEHRQEAHRSKNLEMVKRIQDQKRIARVRRQALSDSTNRPTENSNAFLREILYSEKEASGVMDDVSRALSVAQDIFGEDARKYTAVPAVTSADDEFEENWLPISYLVPDGLIKKAGEQPTKLERLSESVTRKVALNETYSADSDENDNTADDRQSPELPGHKNTPTGYTNSRPDLQKFQRLLDEEELSSIQSAPTVNNNELLAGKQRTTESRSRSLSTKNRKKQLIQSTTDCYDMKKLLDELKSSLTSYEQQFDIQTPEARNLQSDTFTSYTAALIGSVQTMVGYFAEMQTKLEKEKNERVTLENTVYQQQNLVDALTTDLIKIQEQFVIVLDEFERQKLQQNKDIEELKVGFDRLSRGDAVHVVSIKQPPLASVDQVADFKLHKTRSEAPVVTHHTFEGSPEHMTTLSRASMEDTSREQTDNKSEIYPVGQERKGKLTLEEQINQLKGDHQEALDRFQKLSEMRAELQKTVHTASSDTKTT